VAGCIASEIRIWDLQDTNPERYSYANPLGEEEIKYEGKAENIKKRGNRKKRTGRGSYSSVF
jgi:hypothetical protein